MPIIGRISVGDGATFTPSVDNDGVISWSNNKNLENPASVDIPQAVMDRFQLAPIDSPAFTGTPTAPTPTAGDNSTKIATTEFVNGYLSLSGGTMTGDISFNRFSSAIKNTTSTYDGLTTIYGGGGGSTGGYLRTYAYHHATLPGAFEFRANDGNQGSTLQGKPDGTLTWDGKSVPERSYGISLVSTAGQNTYTFAIAENGAVIFAKRGSNASVHMVDYWASGSVRLGLGGTDPITITKAGSSGSVTITNVIGSAVAIKILNGGTL